MADEQVIREPEVKLRHEDVWTHKIEHVAYRNGVEEIREEETVTNDYLWKENHPYHFKQKQLQIERPAGCGDESTTPFFANTGFQGMTVQEIQEVHEGHKERWESSQDCTDLKKLIISMNDGTKVPITNIVCLAIGTFHACEPDWNKRSHIQLAALNTIREVLGVSEKIKCLMQEPNFDEFDKEFLRLQGYEVVNDPAGFAAIDNGSLVFMICGLVGFTDIISRGSWPAVLIHNEIISREDQRLAMIFGGLRLAQINHLCPSLEEDDERMDMIDGCQKEPFPNVMAGDNDGADLAFEDASWCDINIYWRKKE